MPQRNYRYVTCNTCYCSGKSDTVARPKIHIRPAAAVHATLTAGRRLRRSSVFVAQLVCLRRNSVFVAQQCVRVTAVCLWRSIVFVA